MNRLQLAQAVKRESGLTGGGPVSTLTATGDDLRVVNWVDWAWRDIELMHESWLWRRATATGQTNGTTTMAAAASVPGFALTSFSRWLQPARDYQPSAYRVTDGISAERPLRFMSYNDFRQRFLTGTHTPGALTRWTIAPNGDLLVGPTPDSAHLVRSDYIKGHTPMAADADAPGMPADHHMTIVWRALKEYGGFDAASEVWQRADANLNSGMAALAQSQLPPMRWGRGWR
jgi:hypothetical protein